MLAAVPSIGRATGVSPSRAPEADATRALYERYHRQLYSFCLHQLGNREEAEDAVQGTFLNAFRGLKRGIEPQHESAWLFKIAANVCLTRRRASSRRGRVESATDLQEYQDIIPGATRQTDELWGLNEALAAMPEQQRTAILLREWQGLSYKEIATEMSLTQGAVETLIFRARRTLAQGLEEPDTKRGKVRRLRHAIDLGGLLAGLKTFLGGSAAVKVAATVAVATTATSTVVATQTHVLDQKPKRDPKPITSLVAKDPQPSQPSQPSLTRATTGGSSISEVPATAHSQPVVVKHVKPAAATDAGGVVPRGETPVEHAAPHQRRTPILPETFEAPPVAETPPPVSSAPAVSAPVADSPQSTPVGEPTHQPKTESPSQPKTDQPRSDNKNGDKKERAESKKDEKAAQKADAAPSQPKRDDKSAQVEQPKSGAKTEEAPKSGVVTSDNGSQEASTGTRAGNEGKSSSETAGKSEQSDKTDTKVETKSATPVATTTDSKGVKSSDEKSAKREERAERREDRKAEKAENQQAGKSEEKKSDSPAPVTEAPPVQPATVTPPPPVAATQPPPPPAAAPPVTAAPAPPPPAAEPPRASEGKHEDRGEDRGRGRGKGK